MKKKIFLLFGHPDTQARTSKLADAYEAGCRKNGHEIKRLNLGDLKFDPILHKGYSVIQELEPDLLKVQENIKWADHVVIIYPTWWSAMPALLKGMFDRIWLPGFAFRFKRNGLGWQKFLKGKTARVVTTMDSNPLLLRFMVGDYLNEIRYAILGFAGIKTKVTRLGMMKKCTEKRLERYSAKLFKMGMRGK